MKKTITSVILILLMQLLFCSSGEKAVYYRASERADVEIVDGRCGLIRTLYFDVYVEYVDMRMWSYLKRFEIFRGNGEGYPDSPCFHFIIVNTWDRPFILDKVYSYYNGDYVEAEDFSYIREGNYGLDRFSVNLSGMMKMRRILTENILIKEIDYKFDSVEYRLGFIAPGDRVSFFRFFRRVPGTKSSKVGIGIKYFDMKKVIDFDVGRFEYTETEN